MTLKPAHLQWSDDGSLESVDYGDVYFQRKDGLAESDYVFLQGNRLKERFAALPAGAVFEIAELGFGTGMNFLLTADLFLKTAPETARLTFVSIEKHPILREDLEKIHAYWPDLSPLSAPLREQYPPMMAGYHHLFIHDRIRLILIFGAAQEVLPQVTGQFDAWYLDGFSPAKNPDMWQPEFYPLIAARTRAGGTLATFSVTGPMRRALTAEGFTVEKIKGFGIKWSMTIATKNGARSARTRPQRVGVLGAGIAGCSIARSLAMRQCHVTIIERHASFAAEASGNPVAVLYPKMTEGPSVKGDFHTAGFFYSRQWLQAHKVASWTPCGVKHLNINDGDAEHHRAIVEKNFCPPDVAIYDDGLRLTSGGYVQPQDFCARLLNHARIKRDFLHAIDDLEKLFEEYDAVIIALGHQSRAFASTTWLPLQALRGQVTLTRATPESAQMTEVLCHKGYIAPAVDGVHCLGATFQKEEPEDDSTRDEDDGSNIALLQKHVPHLGIGMKDIVGARAAYRTTTPDKLPIAGAAPDYTAVLASHGAMRNGAEVDTAVQRHDKLFILTGFGAHGFSTAPLAAELLAAQMTDECLPVPQKFLPHLIPERFILRDLKRKKI